MARKYELVSQGSDYKLQPLEIGSATTITAGDLVSLDGNKLVEVAAAADTAIAYCPEGSRDGETSCNVTVGNDFVLSGTGDEVFAESYRGGEYDINDTTQTIDFGASSTDVLKVDASENAGTVGETTDILVRINKPIV